MAIVTINQGESIESALRRFKRRVMTEEIIKDAKRHAFYAARPKAKLKSALARKRNKKKGARVRRVTNAHLIFYFPHKLFSAILPLNISARSFVARFLLDVPSKSFRCSRY
jgi:small subunit ribosomal protein S21